VPEPWLRRAANACLALTAWSIPLSTSGMQIGVAGLLVLALIATWRGTPVIRRTPLDVVLLLLAGVFAVSTLASGHPLEGIGWGRLWIVSAYFGVYWWLDDARAAARFARWLVAAAAVVAAYGILQHYTGVDWYRGLLGRRRFVHPRIEGAHGYAAVGFFRNYLTYAHVLILPFGFALASRARGTRLVVVPLLALALVFSTARGAWLAAVAMVLGLMVTSRAAATRLVLLAGVAALAAAISPGFRQQMLPALTDAETNAGRIAIFAANLDVVADHPLLGLGFGRYQKAARPYYERHPRADRRSHAHNNFLQIAAESGLVGLAAWTLLFATALRFGIEAVRRTSDPDVRTTALGACLGLVGFLVGGLTQYSFGDSEVAIAMWATLAVLMCIRGGCVRPPVAVPHS
jgi:O-antigen ligase